MVREVVVSYSKRIVSSPPRIFGFQLERCSRFFSRFKEEDVQLGHQIFVEGM